MLYEQELKTFVDATTNFFSVAAQEPASIGSPYLMEGSPSVHEYTGIISISGKREGVVYFTAPKAMLTVMLIEMQESKAPSHDRRNLVGEVANAVSGDARHHFKPHFVITCRACSPARSPARAAAGGCAARPPSHRLARHSAKLVVSLS